MKFSVIFSPPAWLLSFEVHILHTQTREKLFDTGYFSNIDRAYFCFLHAAQEAWWLCEH